jgi:ubiquinone/menaquinone biosynthesis C-methylase UbiE
MAKADAENIAYYRTLARVYDTIVPRDIKGICDSLEEIVGKNNKVKKPHILDLGCGTGRFTIEMAKRGYAMTGLDITREMLDIAKMKARQMGLKVKFLKADIKNFTLSEKAEVAWARGSVGDIIDLADVGKALFNIRNNLRRNGFFVFDVRDFHYHYIKYKTNPGPETRIIKGIDRTTNFTFDYRLDKDSRIGDIEEETTVRDPRGTKTYRTRHQLRHYTKREIARLVRDAGFKSIKILPGYKCEKYNKPRIVVIAKK